MNKILTEKLPQVAELCRLVGVRNLHAFGSVVRDDFNLLTSDLDFLVEMSASLPRNYFDTYFDLKEGLEKLFNRPVDLVTAEGLENPYFRERVMAERQNVYAS
jgi:uncharacterized protein